MCAICKCTSVIHSDAKEASWLKCACVMEDRQTRYQPLSKRVTTLECAPPYLLAGKLDQLLAALVSLQISELVYAHELYEIFTSVQSQNAALILKYL